MTSLTLRRGYWLLPLCSHRSNPPVSFPAEYVWQPTLSPVSLSCGSHKHSTSKVSTPNTSRHPPTNPRADSARATTRPMADAHYSSALPNPTSSSCAQLCSRKPASVSVSSLTPFLMDQKDFSPVRPHPHPPTHHAILASDSSRYCL